MTVEMKNRYDNYLNNADSEHIKEYNKVFLCLIEQYEKHLKAVYESCEKLTQDESALLAISILCLDYYNRLGNSGSAIKHLLEFIKYFSTIPKDEMDLFTSIERIRGFILFLVNKDKDRKTHH